MFFPLLFWEGIPKTFTNQDFVGFRKVWFSWAWTRCDIMIQEMQVSKEMQLQQHHSTDGHFGDTILGAFKQGF